MSQKPFSSRVQRSHIFFHSSNRAGDGGSAFANASMVSIILFRGRHGCNLAKRLTDPDSHSVLVVFSRVVFHPLCVWIPLSHDPSTSLARFLLEPQSDFAIPKEAGGNSHGELASIAYPILSFVALQWGD